MAKSFILSGHFFSPTGLDPWTGLRSDLGPDRPWKTLWKSMLKECYGANSASRVLGTDGRVQTVVNNYSWMNFSFSPTLLDELSNVAPNVYRRIREADQESLHRWGHGNALAQIVHPVILPLARQKDVSVQLDWAFDAFWRHFHREPEGFYLPRQAVNFSIIDQMISRGVQWILLSPLQAHGMMTRGEGSWTDLGSGPAPTDRIFAIDRPGGSLGVFFENLELGSGMAGGHYLKNAKNLAQKVRSLLDQSTGPLVSAAVDGTWFGRLEPFGDMCLAALWNEMGEQLSNYGKTFEQHPPKEIIKLKRGYDDGGTSATCEHGVERWRSDCGCANPARQGFHQGWRSPLRFAIERLEDALDSCIEQTLNELCWPSDQDFHRCISRWRWKDEPILPTGFTLTQNDLERLMTVTELFFLRQGLSAAALFEDSEPDTAEAWDVWLNITKALDLAKELTVQDVEFSFQQDLMIVKLNTHSHAQEFFETQVSSARKDASYPAALFVLDHLVRAGLKEPIVLGNFRLLRLDQAKDQIADKVFRYSGSLSFTEDQRQRLWNFSYLLVEDLHEGVSIFLQPSGDVSPPQAFDLQKLPQGERDQIVGLLSGDLEDLLTDSTEALFPLLRKSLVYSKLLGSEPLPVTKSLVGLVLNRRLSKELGLGIAQIDEEFLNHIEQELDFAQEFKINLAEERLKELFTNWLATTIDSPHRMLDDLALARLDGLMTILDAHGLRTESTVAQTMVFETLSGFGVELVNKLDSGTWDVLPTVRNLIRLGELFHIDTQWLKDRVLHLGSFQANS